METSLVMRTNAVPVHHLVEVTENEYQRYIAEAVENPDREASAIEGLHLNFFY